MSEREPLIFIASGEASGDNLAGRLMAALKQKTGGKIRFAGVGGPQSEAEGLKSLFPMSELSLMGIAEVLPHLPRLIRRINQTARAARELKPDAVITVDSPDFSFRVARRLQGSGIPVIHYVAPQLWAWRPSRAKKLKARVDHIMAMLPFEVPFFERYGVACTYVGHPAVGIVAELGDGAAFRARHGIAADRRLLCVLPGSRGGEVRRHLPIFGETLALLKEKHPDLQLVVPVVDSVAEPVREASRHWPFPTLLVSGTAERLGAFAASGAALAKSGTVTLELALAGVPLIVAYRLSPVTAFLVRRIGVSVEHASLVNLLLGRTAIPEYLQEDCTAEKLAAGMDEILSSERVRAEQRAAFKEVAEILGSRSPTPSERAAKVVLDIVRARASHVIPA
jgi:lipid-A-disaccharide synthase